jgi:hypothetical protein
MTWSKEDTEAPIRLYVIVLKPFIVSLCPFSGQNMHCLKRKFEDPGRKQEDIKPLQGVFGTKHALL